MIRSRSTALRIPRGRRKALHRRAVFASEAAPPRRDTMRDQSLINRESEFMTPLNRLRFQRSSGYFISAYGVKPGDGHDDGGEAPQCPAWLPEKSGDGRPDNASWRTS